MQVTITINGVEHSADVEPRTLLVHFLRDDLDLTGTHIGCDTGSCGACTVIVDGQPRRSCLLPVEAANGSEIRTIEGLAPAGGELTPIQQAWIHHYAAQCGFCASGFVMAATAYLENGGTDDRDAIDLRMVGEHVLDLCGVHVVPTADVHLLEPADDAQVAAGVSAREVAGVQPSVRVEDRSGEVGVAPVPGHDHRRSHDDLADLAHGHPAAGLVDDPHLDVALVAQPPGDVARPVGERVDDDVGALWRVEHLHGQVRAARGRVRQILGRRILTTFAIPSRAACALRHEPHRA